MQFSLSKNHVWENLLKGDFAIANLSDIGFWIGPVYISIDCPLKFDIDLEVGGNFNLSIPVFIGFTGLYGAGAYVGADYGLTWKKILFLKVPSGFYFKPYFRGESVSEFAFYMGPIDNSITFLMSLAVPANASVYAAVTPKLVFNPRVSAWKLVSLGLEVDTGLKGKFEISALLNTAQKKLPITGTASLYFIADIYGSGRVGIEPFTILGITINFLEKKFKSELIKRFDAMIGKPI
jgi:hypothetical protein